MKYNFKEHIGNLFWLIGQGLSKLILFVFEAFIIAIKWTIIAIVFLFLMNLLIQWVNFLEKLFGV